jgi:hypothetical protein
LALVRVSQATVTGAVFSIDGLVLSYNLNVRYNATLKVEFAAAIVGSVAGTITIISNVSNYTTSIPLSGTGVAQLATTEAPAWSPL